MNKLKIKLTRMIIAVSFISLFFGQTMTTNAVLHHYDVTVRIAGVTLVWDGDLIGKGELYYKLPNGNTVGIGSHNAGLPETFISHNDIIYSQGVFPGGKLKFEVWDDDGWYDDLLYRVEVYINQDFDSNDVSYMYFKASGVNNQKVWFGSNYILTTGTQTTHYGYNCVEGHGVGVHSVVCDEASGVYGFQSMLMQIYITPVYSSGGGGPNPI